LPTHGTTVHLLHTADTHLGYRQYGIIEREKDFYDVFSEIVEIALREHVDAVLHSGDLFDSTRPPPQAFRAAIRSLRLLSEKGIPFIVVAGDHDTPKRSILSPLAVLEDVGVARAIGSHSDEPVKMRIRTRNGIELLIAGVRSQRGVNARQKLLDYFKRLRPEPDTISVLMLHQSIKEAAPDYEVELRELPRGYSYYALGHIHVYREFTLGDSKAVYPGSPEILRVDEAIAQEKRFVILVEVDKKGTHSLQKIPLQKTRPFIYREISYESLDKFKALLAALRDEVKLISIKKKKPLLYLKVKRVPRGTRADLHGLVDMILGNYILDYRLQVETVIETARSTAPTILAEEISLEKLFENYLNDRELAQLALKLIDILSSDPKSHAIREAYSLIAEKFGLEREARLT
jgi:exonuclease SbcD